MSRPTFPEDPRFYRSLIDRLPLPVVVIDGEGRIAYANLAMLELTGWEFADGIGSLIHQFIHPEDAEWAAHAMVAIAESQDASAALGLSTTSALKIRIIAKNGATIPVEVTAGGALDDPDVRGIIYAVRPATSEQLMDSVVAGVAAGDPLEDIMRHLTAIAGLAPHSLTAAVFEQRADGGSRLVTASDPRLAQLPARAIDPVPWAGLGTEPRHVPLDLLPEPTRSIITDIDGKAVFTCGAHAPDMSSTLRLVAVSHVEQGFVRGSLQLMERSRELMSVVLMKTHNDRLLANAASRDDLTGLPNRLGLNRRFERITSSGADSALLFVDLDDFKKINDRYGHLAGDRVLAAVADRLRRAVRVDDLVTRIGGDEFAVVLSEPEGRLAEHVVVQLAERVVAMLADPIKIDGRSLPVSASVGVARVSSNGDLDQLMGRADRAMYEAKRAGGGRLHIDQAPAA